MKNLVILIVLSVLLISCQKKEQNPVAPVESNNKVTDYYPLTIGNYWIYEFSQGDSSSNLTYQNKIDSIYVEKDSLINGKIFKVLKSTLLQQTTLIRDSSDYIVSSDGQKIFSINPAIDILSEQYLPANDSSYLLVWKMKGIDSVFNCPLGQYLSKYVLGTLTQIKPSAISNIKERNIFSAYSKGIGMVGRRATYLFGGQLLEWKLLRYKINEKIN